MEDQGIVFATIWQVTPPIWTASPMISLCDRRTPALSALLRNHACHIKLIRGRGSWGQRGGVSAAHYLRNTRAVGSRRGWRRMIDPLCRRLPSPEPAFENFQIRETSSLVLFCPPGSGRVFGSRTVEDDLPITRPGPRLQIAERKNSA